jgi:hypothetical protein
MPPTPEEIARERFASWECGQGEALVAAVAAIVRDAVRDEREACAKLAETTGRLHPLFADQILQQAIADAIRKRADA